LTIWDARPAIRCLIRAAETAEMILEAARSRGTVEA
jgi:hypothetical protein